MNIYPVFVGSGNSYNESYANVFVVFALPLSYTNVTVYLFTSHFASILWSLAVLTFVVLDICVFPLYQPLNVYPTLDIVGNIPYVLSYVTSFVVSVVLPSLYLNVTVYLFTLNLASTVWFSATNNNVLFSILISL